MFYTVWYICCAARLTAKESRSVMRLVEAIEDKEMPIVQRNDAVQGIAGIDPLVGTALVPFLVESLIAEGAENEPDDSEAGISRQKYYDVLENAILQFLRCEGNSETKEQVQQLHMGDCDGILKYVRRTMADFTKFPEHHEGFSPYQDADLYVKESFILALMVSVGERDSSIIKEFVSGESEWKIIQLAQRGELGQICWNLSMRLELILGEETPENLIKNFPDRWQERPDLVELIMPYLFPEEIERTEEEADKIRVDELLEEACSLTQFSAFWRHNKPKRSDSFWLWAEASEADCTRSSIVMWQHIIWSLTFVRNPDETIRKLQWLWSAPTFKCFKEGEKSPKYYFLTQHQRYMFPRFIKLEREEFADKYICSPWQQRTEYFSDDSSGVEERNEWNEDALFHAFRHLAKGYNALKAFCAVRLLGRILQYSRGNINVNYITLFLNLGDAFSSFGARNTFEILDGRGDSKIRSLAWTAPIRTLGFYADKSIDEIGTGQKDVNIPAEIMRKIKDRSPYFSDKKQKGTNHQILLIYRFSGLFCAARWALLALRNHSVRFNGAINPWLEGEPESYMARLVRYLDVIRDQKDEKTKMPYKLPRDSMELFFAMTEIVQACQYELDDPGFSECEPERVGLGDLILKNNPSESMWRCVGELDPERFRGEIYVIALTNRLRARFEECEEGGKWFEQWKELMEDPKRRSWITHLAQLALLRLLKVKAVNRNGGLKIAKDYILKYFIGERNDSPIFYYKTIADQLIGDDNGVGPYEMSEWRGNFAVQLYKRCRETMGNSEIHNRWMALYYYFLWGIREELCDDNSLLAREKIVNHWNSYAIHSWDLRTVMKDSRDWDPIQDRFWAEEQGRLLTVGSQLDTSMRFDQRFTIADQFRKAPQEYNQWKVGIIAKISDKEICFYLGDGTEAVYGLDSTENKSKTETKYRIGDICGVQVYEQGKVKAVKDLGAFPAPKGYIEVPKVRIAASEISIYTREKMISYQINETEELFLLWSGDTVDFLKKGTQDIRNVHVTYCKYDGEKNGWIPKERNFDELILNHLLKGGEQENGVILTYLKSIDEDKLLFSIAAGENYALERDYFTKAAWAEIQKYLFDGKERSGMRVKVVLAGEEGFPKLELSGDDAFDDINIRWMELFNTQKPFQIRYESGRWILDCEMPYVRNVLQASVVDSQERIKLIPGKRYNVEATTDGWTLCEMRTSRVKVAFLQTHVLNARMPYDEFKMLVELEPGMVFRLRNVSTMPQRRGYRTAYLDNGMKVFCADESISFQKNWKAETFGKRRLCIVDNVKETSPEDAIPENMRGIWPECLEKIGYSVSGILAEYAANINAETENIENFALKVFMDVEGKMQSIDVPLYAFWPAPDNLGERIDAVRTSKGWIFKVTKRDIINVRALWRMQYHDDEEVEVIGEPLGLVALARNTTYAMTQDTDEPLLHAYGNKIIHISKEQCGVALGKGSVSIIWSRFSDSHCFPWAYKTNVVELKIGTNSFVGEAKQSDFRDNRTGWNVHAEIHNVYTEEDCEYYDLRRVFTRTRSVKMEDSQDKAGREDWIRKYKEWYLGGERHAFVSFVGPFETASKVLLRDLRVPKDPDCGIDKAEFIDMVELEFDHEPIVRGHEPQYITNDIRVRLKIVDGQWIASVRDAEAWCLNGKLFEYLGRKSGGYIRKTFYFAGRDEKGNMIFEWGYGNYFKARNEDIVDMNGGTFAYEFFFGDSIRAVTFVPDDEGEYGWKARIRQEDISHEIEGQIWEDSYENIVQLLKVRKDKHTGRIKIYKVSARSRFISTSRAGANAWRFKDGPNAVLSEESQNKLQNEIGTKEEMVVFAHINEEMSDREKRDTFFEYISLDIREGQLGLLENKILCLKAYKIQETGDPSSRNRVANDYKICFYLPEELPTKCEKPRLVMSVNRRKFSLDESRLRLDALSDPDKYVGSNMLVSLGELSMVESSVEEVHVQKKQEDFVTHYWRGSVTSAPRRSLESLKQWLAGMSPYLVTLACSEKKGRKSQPANSGRKVFAEIVPGIICDITAECTDPLIMDGTLARLSLENDQLCTRIFLFGDTQYFSERKRPVELLIMDDKLNHYNGSVDESNTNEDNGEDVGNHFTVASFPQILLKNRTLMDGLIREGLPRVGVVHFNMHKELEVEANKYFEVGYLDIRQEDFSPLLKIVKPENQLGVGTWDQMTFKDGTVSEIVNNINDGKWHYHDRYTGLYMENSKSMVRCMLSNGEDFKEIVTFYAHDRRLRYTVQELGIFGMSAREIVEHGLPRNNSWYPIAEGQEHNVWIEFFPGKVADVSANYLMAGSMRCNLSGLCMSTFGAGDEMLLLNDKENTGGQYEVLLMDFRFSGRDAVRNSMAVLPVVDVLDDGLVLGGGIYSFTYPIGREETGKYYKNQAVILDIGNRLDANVQFMSLKYGAVVYVSLDDRNRMIIPGMEDVQVSPAYEHYWTNAGWLYKIIHDKKEVAFKIFENYIPMTITQIDSKNHKIWVAYQQENVPKVNEGQSLAVNCIGVLPNQFEDGRVVLRSGNYLFLVEGKRILKGVNSFEFREICKRLSELRIGFFMTMTPEGWKNGLSLDMCLENIDIELICSVDGARGYIVKSMKDFSLKYLPLHAACRVKTDETEKVWVALTQHPKRTARIMREDIVSLIDEYKSVESYQKLRLMYLEENDEVIGRAPDGYNERVIPRVFWKEETGCFYYFGELYPMGDIILLKSEYKLACGQETDPISVELLEGSRDNIVVVPSGEKRQRIHLSKWLLANMRENYYRNYDKDAEFHGDIQIDKFVKDIPQRFKKYGVNRDKALRESGKYFDKGLLRDDTKINERLVYLFFKETRQGADNENNEFKKQCAFTLVNWLRESGKFLSSGFGRGSGTSIDMDLIPTIAAICILDEIEVDGKEKFRELSVHLARMLGYACGLSIHEEQLIYGWIRKEHSGEHWNKIRHLSLGGETLPSQDNGKKVKQDINFDGLLSPVQYKAVTENAESILRFATLDKYVRNTVYALLLSVADFRDYSEFFNQLRRESELYCTVKLAPIGRLLTPAYGRRSSYDCLPDAIRSLLVDVLKKHTERNIELCTSTEIPLDDEERRYWSNEVEKCIALCKHIINTKRNK